jgi:hypothetical protein
MAGYRQGAIVKTLLDSMAPTDETSPLEPFSGKNGQIGNTTNHRGLPSADPGGTDFERDFLASSLGVSLATPLLPMSLTSPVVCFQSGFNLCPSAIRASNQGRQP